MWNLFLAPDIHDLFSLNDKNQTQELVQQTSLTAKSAKVFSLTFISLPEDIMPTATDFDSVEV